MSKLSRSKLKSIVKECLVEILQDGLVNSSSDSLMMMEGNASRSSSISSPQQSSGVHENTRSQRQMSARASHLDTIKYGNAQSNSRKAPNPDFERNISDVTAPLTSDPVLAEIFKDTAMTTLQEQLVHDKKGAMGPVAGDSAAYHVSKSDPMDMFGESSKNWAALAFSDSANK